MVKVPTTAAEKKAASKSAKVTPAALKKQLAAQGKTTKNPEKAVFSKPLHGEPSDPKGARAAHAHYAAMSMEALVSECQARGVYRPKMSHAAMVSRLYNLKDKSDVVVDRGVGDAQPAPEQPAPAAAPDADDQQHDAQSDDADDRAGADPDTADAPREPVEATPTDAPAPVIVDHDEPDPEHPAIARLLDADVGVIEAHLAGDRSIAVEVSCATFRAFVEMPNLGDVVTSSASADAAYYFTEDGMEVARAEVHAETDAIRYFLQQRETALPSAEVVPIGVPEGEANSALAALAATVQPRSEPPAPAPAAEANSALQALIPPPKGIDPHAFLAGSVADVRAKLPAPVVPPKPAKAPKPKVTYDVMPVISSSANKGWQSKLIHIEKARGNLPALLALQHGFKRTNTYGKLAGRFVDDLIERAQAGVDTLPAPAAEAA